MLLVSAVGRTARGPGGKRPGQTSPSRGPLFLPPPLLTACLLSFLEREDLWMWCRSLACLFKVPCQLSGSARHRSPWLPRGRGTIPAAVARCHHTAPESLKCAWQLHGDHLELRYANTLMRFDFVWLRDHCRSASCYNAKTNQRSLDTASVDLGIKPKAVRVDEATLSPIEGPDGHVTRYGLEWLVKNSYEGQKQQVMHPRIFWNAEIYRQAQVPSVDCRSFLETDEGLKEFLQNFLLYGIAFVENVAPTKEDTEILAERISLIRETIYGRMWYFTSDFSRGDTAYTKLALDRHTDTTYFQEPCGIQVFHCLKHEGTGGRTLLVDGFYAAEQVLRQAPEQFELLTKVPLKHEYVENVGDCHNHMIGVGPVLNVYPWNNELYLIRYNNYDRAVINTVPYDVVHRWYAAHRTLTAELRRPENELWVKLKPGKALFIDNWRVLHGREAFTGYRQLCGCYLTRDDVLNTARVLGLQA
ncbi:trimethyllysine dioxygenase, mitochondrial [Egretta garzetta]|uniref:trimethyllysine dioxygenase, mitochondrial n=1 Tax=Egretta garzetta TaxID=188379 RepID=UPI00163BEF05|nr:trimethyllysine dioxygenase, mitochondrial [Egretta garzetta]